MSRRLVLDATPLLFGGAGVGRVTGALLKFMLAEPSHPEFALYARCLRGPRLEVPGSLPVFHLRAPQRFEPLLKATGWIEHLTKGDLYHATDHYLPLKHPERCVVTVHDMMFLTHPEPGLETHQRQAKLVPPFLEQCQRVIAVSDYTKQDILNCTRVPEERIDVIHWAVDREFFTPAPDREHIERKLHEQFGVDRAYFLSVGCSLGRKNTPRLIEAFSRVLHEYPREQLVLVWNPPPEIKRLCDESKGRIRYTGRVSDEQLRDLYRGARCMLYPSLYEGFGLPVLEAMSCGTPVITSTNTSLPEVGGEAVVYVDAEDVDSIHDAIAAVCSGATDLEALRQKGTGQIMKFSWVQTARKTLDVYEQCQ